MQVRVGFLRGTARLQAEGVHQPLPFHGVHPAAAVSIRVPLLVQPACAMRPCCSSLAGSCLALRTMV